MGRDAVTRRIGDLTAADLGTSGHVREFAASRGATGRLTYLHELVGISHYTARNGLPITTLTDQSGVIVPAAPNTRWEVDKPAAAVVSSTHQKGAS